MNAIVETFQRQRSYALFDKFWYLKRAVAFKNINYQGLYVDSIDNVCQVESNDTLGIGRFARSNTRRTARIDDIETESLDDFSMSKKAYAEPTSHPENT